MNRVGRYRHGEIETRGSAVGIAAAGYCNLIDRPSMSIERPVVRALAGPTLPTNEIDAAGPRREPLEVQHGWDFKAFATFLKAQDAAWVMNKSATSRSPALAALPHQNFGPASQTKKAR